MKRWVHTVSAVCLLVSVALPSAGAGEGADAVDLLRRIVVKLPPDAKVMAPKRITQQTHQLYDCHLPPVWYAEVMRGKQGAGYLMWDVGAPGRLAEFALDPAWAVAGSDTIPGVPNGQQFRVPGKSYPEVASGCVPTSAANVLAYWGGHGFAGWLAGDEAGGLRALTRRLRARLKMEELPDEGGYTDGGMPLSGANPEELASAIRADATAHGLRIEVEWAPFSSDVVRREVIARRPVLLSCEVRLPQKPQLAWGHEVTGIGWVKVGEDAYIGVRDNFYPGADPDTTRWIRADYFESVITIHPLK